MGKAASIEEYREKWNVPDWRAKPEYEYTLALSPHQIRWEFLRRMDYYRSAWDSGNFTSDLDFGLTEMYAPWVRSDDLPDGFAFFDSALIGTPLNLEGLREILSSEDSEESFEFTLGERIIDLTNHGYVLIPFDPGYSIENQVEAASKALKRRKQELKKSRINQSRVRTYDNLTLLRALDADNELNHVSAHQKAMPQGDTLTMTEIARVIFDKGLSIGDTPEANAAHTYFANAVKYARRMALRPIFKDR
jgi:hypothetical protein